MRLPRILKLTPSGWVMFNGLRSSRILKDESLAAIKSAKKSESV